MLAALLITLREVIEATLIVATILGILTKLHHHKSIRTVWIATIAAACTSIGLLFIATRAGIHIQQIYSGKTEDIIEGGFMIISAFFITGAVFFLHRYFARNKAHLLQHIQHVAHKPMQKGLFILVFTAVFREGFEIVLFLSTIFLSTNPQQVFTGFGLGLVSGLLISFAFFSATIRLPVYYAFRTTSILLILFAAGLLGRGIHEFTEIGLLPELSRITFSFIPHNSTVIGGVIKSMFGITQSMDFLQLLAYGYYVAFMSHWVFIKRRDQLTPISSER